MEEFQELREMAKKKISIADHILTQTYPLVEDPKVLLAVMENLFLAATNSMASILSWERLFKRIPPYQDNFDSKYNMFRTKIAPKHNLDAKSLDMVIEVKDILIKHRQSPVEFTRKDKFVICDEDYKMKTVHLEDIKAYIESARTLVKLAESVTAQNEEIFND